LSSLVRELEKPLPGPRRDPAGYAATRVLEALLEAILALEYLEKGYTRNAAGKAFQAWRALTGALLALEKEKLEKYMKDEERKWLLEVAIPRVPSSRLKPLSRLVERAGYEHFSAYTDKALDLHDYQYHGPDPSGELSKYPDEGDAVEDILSLLRELQRIVAVRVRPLLEKEKAWAMNHDEAVKRLEERLTKTRTS